MAGGGNVSMENLASVHFSSMKHQFLKVKYGYVCESCETRVKYNREDETLIFMKCVLFPLLPKPVLLDSIL